jgi:hypothetical protein
MMMSVNVFCDISIANAKLYKTSLDLMRKLRSFNELSSSLNQTKTLKEILKKI